MTAIDYRELADFPVDNLDDALRELRRPFKPAAVKWKLQSRLGDKGGLVVGYIDARLVIERLNLVVGGQWQPAYQEAQGGMWCHLTVLGVTRPDFGEGRGKALVSDSLKRAAVQFGVGRSIYAMASVKMWKGDGPNQLRANWKGELDLDDANRAWLSEQYAKWLDVRGEQAFGPALDHGDVADAQGDPDEQTDDPAGDEDGAPPVEPAPEPDAQSEAEPAAAVISEEAAAALIAELKRRRSTHRRVTGLLGAARVKGAIGCRTPEAAEQLIRGLTVAQYDDIVRFLEAEDRRRDTKQQEGAA